LTPEELSERLHAGENMFEIAEAQGVDLFEMFPGGGEMFSEMLGLNLEELKSRLQAGEAPWEIMQDLGISPWNMQPHRSPFFESNQ
jgi:hypothetical protein